MRKHGFTLIEILLVLGILLVLAVALATYSFQAWSRAREAALRHYLDEARGVALVFHTDHARYPLNLGELTDSGLRPPRPEYHFVYAGGDTDSFCAWGQVGQITLRVEAAGLSVGACP
ncbi:MAG: prepilin-type N-terminal cleavage/methylation domain-containing protein [Meiothermus silvanus]|nr:prepilin-type N-terminal cleavage/methylation domain-containing protein [Allomeiothermus silvanus]